MSWNEDRIYLLHEWMDNCESNIKELRIAIIANKSDIEEYKEEIRRLEESN